MKRILLLYFLTLFTPIFGQVNFDSIQKKINLIDSDTAKVRKLLSLSDQFIDSGEFRAVISFAEQVILLAKKKNDLVWLAKANNKLGIAKWYQGNLTEALNYYLEAIKNFEFVGDKKGVADCWGNIGIIYAMQENYTEAIVCQEKALKIDEEAKDYQGMAYVYNNLGLIYYYQGSFQEALKNHKQALALKQQIGDSIGASASYDNLGVLYDELGDFEKALENYYLSLKIAESSGNQKGIISSFNNIGTIYVRKKNYEEAKKYMFKALSLSEKNGMKQYLKDNYKGISDVFHMQGDYKNAYKYYLLYSNIKDSLFNQESTKTQAKLEAKFDFDKKATADSVKNFDQIKVEQLKHDQEIYKQKTYTLGGIIGFALMLVVAFVLIRSNKQKQKAKLEIEMQKEMVEEKQKEIIDSITYARRIQKSLLPTEKYIENTISRLNKN